MSGLHVLVADDERLARRKLCRFLSAEPDVESVAECQSGAEAIQAIRERAPDVLFLDVEMPAPDGFEVLRAVGPSAVGHVVFVTAHAQYAVRAFEVRALDYLLKPFDRTRFRAALDRVRARPKGESARRLEGWLDAGGPSGAAERIVVRSHGRIALLAAETIDWVEAADNYARLHAGRREHLVRSTLAALQARLGARFVRVHRRALVNLAAVLEVRAREPHGHEILLRSGERVRLARAQRSGLLRALGR